MLPPKPMLADPAEKEKIVFPVLASCKVDGLRVLIKNGVAYSRNLKVIRNKFVQKTIKQNAAFYEGIDGEIVVGPPNAKDVFQKSTSGCMSEDGEPDFIILGFDRWDLPNLPYKDRLLQVPKEIRMPTKLITNLEDLNTLEEKCVREGFEGLMVRSIDGPYKNGRSSVREGYLLKIKRYIDDEGVIIGFEALNHNANEATKDNLGRTKRSSHKENLIPLEMMGKLFLKLRDGQTLRVGTGMDNQTREALWKDRENLYGKYCKFRYTPAGMKDLPRFPVYLGIRHEDDIS